MLVILFAAGCLSCMSTLYIPSQKDALTLNISLEKLQQGRQLYINKCAGCHNLYLPSGYTSKEWAPIMDKMQSPGKIDDVEKELIMNYLNSGSKKE